MPSSSLVGEFPYPLSSAAGTSAYGITSTGYDVVIDSLPFLLNVKDDTPYRRQTAQWKKDQVDLSGEPGEHSITGWWVRAQSSFHRGEGIKFYDPTAGEITDYRIADSRGVNVWTKGEVSLLNSATSGHTIAGIVASNLRPQQESRSIVWGSTSGVLVLDYDEIDKIDSAGTVTDFVNTTGQPIYAMCDDGVYAYWLTKSGGFLQMNKKLLTDNSGVAATTMFTHASIVPTNATMEFVKERIIACVNNAVYELTTVATVLPTALYTNPNTTYVYTCVSASGPAIYISGFNGPKSSIQKFTLSTAGVMPTLTSAITAAEFPIGEVVMSTYYYLGILLIGTTRGIRAAAVSDQDGSLTYGPLIVETTQPCYDFAGRDHFVWCATGVAGQPGVIRIDLSEQITLYRYAYANDVYDNAGSAGHPTSSVAFCGSTSSTVVPQLTFTTCYASGVAGAHYIQSQTEKMSSGYVTTGAIRYSTLEPKMFKTIHARVDNTYGSLELKSISKAGDEYAIVNFAKGDFTPEVSITYPVGSQEILSFKFILTRDAGLTTKGPIFTGYQLKALPAINRQRLIQYPVMCYDAELDKSNNPVGYQGRAWARIKALEDKENLGDTVRVTDFRTGESYLGVIEELSFTSMTPTDKRFTGFGGTLLATIRTV